jgi:hypothetical protein
VPPSRSSLSFVMPPIVEAQPMPAPDGEPAIAMTLLRFALRLRDQATVSRGLFFAGLWRSQAVLLIWCEGARIQLIAKGH